MSVFGMNLQHGQGLPCVVESYDANYGRGVSDGRHSTASRIYACARRQIRCYSVLKVSVALVVQSCVVKSEVLRTST